MLRGWWLMQVFGWGGWGGWGMVAAARLRVHFTRACTGAPPNVRSTHVS